MKRLIFIAVSLFITLTLYSHPWKPSHYVIVDTDGGVDDIKAITMLLASPDVRVLAITVSPGVLSTENAYKKVKSLLNSFYHEGIPVGINKSNSKSKDEFPVALQTIWGDESRVNMEQAPGNMKLISEILAVEKTKISFISLGSMTTAYSALKEIPSFRKQVKEIIWSVDGAVDTKGYNYNIDKKASEKMLKQEVPVHIVRKYIDTDVVFYDDELIRSISTVNTAYAEKITEFFNSVTTKNHSFSYEGTDEMVAVFIHYPDLFLNKILGNISESIPSDFIGIKESMLRILKGETVNRNQVIRQTPVDPSFYFEDVGPVVTEIVSMYGIDEWTSGVIANELHRHLGIYTIIGVKMGIRAREYFNTGVDEFKATSYAGSISPLSCMNDGLQVSTGATPGHGLLTVRNDTVTRPAVDITYLNRRIRLTLKPELIEKISSSLKEYNFVYGLDSNIYWELVRKDALKYWLELDRHDIFIIEEM